MRKYNKLITAIICLSLFSPMLLEAAKKRKHKGEYKGVKYEDVLVVLGITKELYFDFPVGNVRMPTNSSVVKPEIQRKAQNPELTKDRIDLIGQNEGFTDLWVYDDKKVLKIIYHIQTTKNDLKRIFRDVRNRLKDIEGLIIKIRDDKIFMGGDLLLPTDIVKIIQVVSTYPPVFILNYRVSPAVWNLIAEKMQKEINMPEVTVRVVNERFILEGFVNSEEEKTYVVKRAALFLPKFYQILPSNISGAGVASAGELKSPSADWMERAIIDDFIKIKAQPVDPDKDVKVMVHFVEITKDFNKSFGFTWSPTIGDNTSVTTNYNFPSDSSSSSSSSGLTGTVAATISNFIPKLKNAVEHKRARVLQTAAITVRAGNNPGGEKPEKKGAEGSIEKTTKIPFSIPSSGNSGPSVGSVEVGLRMNVTVAIEGDKNTSKVLSVKLGFSISAPTTKTKEGVMGTSTDAISTYVTLNSGETAAIGGLIQNVADIGYGKTPSDNVIIDLSRSKSFQKSASQFVVFLTPQILSSASEGSEEAKQKFRIGTHD